MGQLLASGTYRPRIADAQIERYLRLFGAVEISGTKWCGKTWAAMAHGESITYVDRGANLQIVQADPAYALAGDIRMSSTNGSACRKCGTPFVTLWTMQLERRASGSSLGHRLH